MQRFRYMSDDNLSVSRRKRVNFIKGLLITVVIIMIITPTIVSIVAISGLKKLDSRIDELDDKISKLELTYMLKAQADEALDELIGEKETHIIEQNDPAADEKTKNIQTETVNENIKKVYLTFDDGPSSTTGRILDILDDYGIKATFFVTGYQAEKHPEWYKDIVDRGHTIGMHSYSHIYKDIYSSPESFFVDLDKLHDYIEKTTGVDTHYVRFPGGTSNNVSRVSVKDLCDMVHERGWEYYDWNISCKDATSPAPNADQIVSFTLTGIEQHSNCIVLMHDASDKQSTIEALPRIIEAVQAQKDTQFCSINDETEPVQHLLTGYDDED